MHVSVCVCVNKLMYGCLCPYFICVVFKRAVWRPHRPLLLSSLVYVCPCPSPNLQEIWMDTGGTTRLGIAVRPPQCLWWDMWGPALTLTPTHLPPFSLFLPVCLSSQSPESLVISCFLRFIYTSACCFSVFLSVFYPTPVGESQRGKRKTFEQTFMSEPTHTLSERQKKMVRFGGHSFEEDLTWCEPQVKDSGVDTCSSTTLNEEHSHSEKVLSQCSLHFVVIYDLPIQSLFALCH